MAKDHPLERHRGMVEDILNNEDAGLNDWEINFIGSISRQLEESRSLSAKQIACLDKIWDKTNKTEPEDTGDWEDDV